MLKQYSATERHNLILSYFLVTLVLVLEVTVFFRLKSFPIPRMLEFLLFCTLGGIWFFKGNILDRRIIVALFVLVGLILLQGVFFGIRLTTVFTYPAFVLLIPFFLYRIVGYKVFNYLVDIVFYTALISTAIWLLQNLIPPFDAYLQSLRGSSNPFVQGGLGDYSLLFIHTIHGGAQEFFGIDIYRNPGLYHEPGAFAHFLVLAIGLNTILQNAFWNKRNIILCSIVITTFSTAGYLALFPLLGFAVLQLKIRPSAKALILMLFVFILSISTITFEFLGEKIVDQYETQMHGELRPEFSGGRIERIRRALNLFSTSPIIGRGIITEARDFHPTSRYYFTGAGAWRTLSSYGIIFAPIIFFLFYRGIKNLCILHNYNQRFALFFFVAVLVNATSQRFMLDNITILLFIFGLLYSQKEMLRMRSHQVKQKELASRRLTAKQV